MTKHFPRVAGAAQGRPFPPAMQVAALCWRKRRGKIEVLLITSRDTGRWIVPKGWPIDGLNAAQSALCEAWEEAGVRGDAEKAHHIGQFCYDKVLRDGVELPIRAEIYKVRLREEQLEDQYPEAHERKRIWVAPRRAAKMVMEPELQEILRKF